MRLLLDQDILEAPIEQMSGAVMAFVESLDVSAEKPLHPGREGTLGRLDREVVVRRHQRVVVKDPVRSLNLLAQQVEKQDPVGVVAKIAIPSLPRDMT